MTAAGGQTYSVSVNRSTRKLTISATSNFSLLLTSGTKPLNAHSLMGFTGADLSGSNSYTGDSPSGSEYRPQFLLQQYMATSDHQQAASSSVNKSGSGNVEVVSFGTEKFMECNITFITDINQGTGNPIETNLSGVSDLRTFMQYLITRQPIEFMEDRDTPGTYEKLILERTPGNRDGTGFMLRELYAKGLPGYYETGRIQFREVT